MLAHLLGQRAPAKAVSYRLTSLLVTAAVAFLVVGRPAAALGVGPGASAVKLGVYSLHERAWERNRPRVTPEGQP